ncbi:hypothetical protein GCM10020258_28610 [Sphingomonas yabuuchiae]
MTTLALEDVTVRFRDGVCEEAAGRVRATVVGEAGGLPLPPMMMGTARCEAGALLLPMTGQGAPRVSTCASGPMAATPQTWS